MGTYKTFCDVQGEEFDVVVDTKASLRAHLAGPLKFRASHLEAESKYGCLPKESFHVVRVLASLVFALPVDFSTKDGGSHVVVRVSLFTEEIHEVLLPADVPVISALNLTGVGDGKNKVFRSHDRLPES